MWSSEDFVGMFLVATWVCFLDQRYKLSVLRKAMINSDKFHKHITENAYYERLKNMLRERLNKRLNRKAYGKTYGKYNG